MSTRYDWKIPPPGCAKANTLEVPKWFLNVLELEIAKV
jgi:hypothetical protein